MWCMPAFLLPLIQCGLLHSCCGHGTHVVAMALMLWPAALVLWPWHLAALAPTCALMPQSSTAHATELTPQAEMPQRPQRSHKCTHATEATEIPQKCTHATEATEIPQVHSCHRGHKEGAHHEPSHICRVNTFYTRQGHPNRHVCCF